MSDRSTYIAIDNNAPYPNTVNASNPLPVTIPTGTTIDIVASTPLDVNVKNTSIPITAAALPLPNGASTNDSDDKINLLIKLLLQKGSEAPVWLDVVNNALRTTNVTSQAVTISSGTVTAVTTVGTLTNQTNIGGYSADLMTVNASETDWGITTRMLLI